MRAFKSNSPIIKSHLPIPYQDIFNTCPAVFASQPAPERSKHFKHVSTLEALEALNDEGFLPFMVAQTKTRDADRLQYARHMIRLRRESDMSIQGANEIILYNANDGTSAATMVAGYIRFACANGLVTGDNMNQVKIYHRGNVTGEYIEGAYQIVKDFEKVDAHRDGMMSIEVPKEAAIIYAEQALSLKYDSPPDEWPIDVSTVLQARRREDTKTDLWTTFNVVQENLIKGGQRGSKLTRPVNGIKENFKLNQALWTLTEKMAAILH